jgi:hypothetical protein
MAFVGRNLFGLGGRAVDAKRRIEGQLRKDKCNPEIKNNRKDSKDSYKMWNVERWWCFVGVLDTRFFRLFSADTQIMHDHRRLERDLVQLLPRHVL